MENPTSFRLLYLLTQISYWGLIAIMGIVVFAGIIMLSLDPELMKLGFAFDLSTIEKVIYLKGGGNTAIPVEFIANSIEVPVKHLDRLSMVYVLVMALIWLACVTIIVSYFKTFMRRVLDGQIFNTESIFLIKKAAWGLIILEAIELLTAVLGYFYVQQNFDLGNLEHGLSWSFPSSILVLALILWVLAHIFQKGKELEDEQKLTV